jgi:ribose transport system substrate-binding protein
MHLGLNILRGQMVPPYNYVAHKVLTRSVLQAAI